MAAIMSAGLKPSWVKCRTSAPRPGAKANRLSHTLIDLGIREDTIVGLILERGIPVYITRQGILKAGGAFLPMVPEYPDDRIDFCLTDAECPYVITTEKIKEERSSLWNGKPYRVLTVEIGRAHV